MFQTALAAALALLATALQTAPLDSIAPLSPRTETSVSSVDRRTSVISGHSMESWNLELAAGVPATIVVDGDGDSDLDVFLFDENGSLIDSDDDLTDYCIVNVTPRWTGSFTVEVVNVGRRANLYSIELR